MTAAELLKYAAELTPEAIASYRQWQADRDSDRAAAYQRAMQIQAYEGLTPEEKEQAYDAGEDPVDAWRRIQARRAADAAAASDTETQNRLSGRSRYDRFMDFILPALMNGARGSTGMFQGLAGGVATAGAAADYGARDLANFVAGRPVFDTNAAESRLNTAAEWARAGARDFGRSIVDPHQYYREQGSPIALPGAPQGHMSNTDRLISSNWDSMRAHYDADPTAANKALMYGANAAHTIGSTAGDLAQGGIKWKDPTNALALLGGGLQWRGNSEQLGLRQPQAWGTPAAEMDVPYPQLPPSPPFAFTPKPAARPYKLPAAPPQPTLATKYPALRQATAPALTSLAGPRPQNFSAPASAPPKLPDWDFDPLTQKGAE
jgi:hypothetical protein